MIILVTLLIIVAIPLVVALFIKKEYSVEREIVIRKPKHLVFDYLKYLKNQDNFSKWASMDPKMKKEYRGTDGTVGFVSAWDSKDKNVGKGEQEIKKITENKRIDFEIRFIKPFAGTANAYLTIDSTSNNETIVNWGFDSKMKYPMNLMLLFMNMEKMIGNDLSTGLSNLKNILEK
jgi:hypothetical protein